MKVMYWQELDLLCVVVMVNGLLIILIVEVCRNIISHVHTDACKYVKSNIALYFLLASYHVKMQYELLGSQHCHNLPSKFSQLLFEFVFVDMYISTIIYVP